MNNPKSTVLGWGSLIAAAGVSYYFAKKSIDERRREQYAAGTRPTEKLDWRARIEKDEQQVSASASLPEAREHTRPESAMPHIGTGNLSNDGGPADASAKKPPK